MFKLRKLRENIDDDHFQNYEEYEGGDATKAPAAAEDTEAATPAATEAAKPAATTSTPLLDVHGNPKVEPHVHV